MSRIKTTTVVVESFSVLLKEEDIHFSPMMDPAFLAFSRFMKEEHGRNFGVAYSDMDKVFTYANNLGEKKHYVITAVNGASTSQVTDWITKDQETKDIIKFKIAESCVSIVFETAVGYFPRN